MIKTGISYFIDVSVFYFSNFLIVKEVNQNNKRLLNLCLDHEKEMTEL